jgi:hypothetical protein
LLDEKLFDMMNQVQSPDVVDMLVLRSLVFSCVRRVYHSACRSCFSVFFG